MRIALIPVIGKRHGHEGQRRRTGGQCHGGPASAIELYTSSVVAQLGLGSCRSACTRTVTGCKLRENVSNSGTHRGSARRCCQSVRGLTSGVGTGIISLRRRGRATRRRLEQTGGRVRARGLGKTTAATTTGVTRDINSLFNDGGIGALRERGATLRGHVVRLRRRTQRQRQRRTGQVRRVGDACRRRGNGLSRFIGFIGYCFPCIRGLVPAVGFLHSHLNFSSNVVQELYAFGSITVGNGLCSSRFGRDFRAGHSVYTVGRGRGKGFSFGVSKIPRID